ncbi:MAG: LytTR family DNA-binding domain-containing protein [Mucilaginibacter sp.]
MDKTLRCIVVDDEEGAHLVIKHYLQTLNSVQLTASFFNAVEALAYLHQNPIDLMFLDINMPGLTGLQMLKSLSNPPMVVLTTAYSEHALESYEYRVVDYLVKPFDFQRFIRAIDNVFSRVSFKATSFDEENDNDVTSSITLKVDGGLIKVQYNDIIYIQSWGNYVKVHTLSATYLTSITTAEVEQKLDKSKFKRIHKSYIVSLNKIKKINGGQLELEDGSILPVGNTYRRDVLVKLL